MAKQI